MTSQRKQSVKPAVCPIIPHQHSFTEGFPLFMWLLKLETVAHPLLKAVLHVPYVSAAVPLPNHKWLGHACTDRYILCIHTWPPLLQKKLVDSGPTALICGRGWRGALSDAVHGLYLKSTQAKWYVPRAQSACVKYVGLIFINFLVVVIWEMDCVTKKRKKCDCTKQLFNYIDGCSCY